MAQTRQDTAGLVESDLPNLTLQAIWEKFDRLKSCRDEAFILASGNAPSEDWAPAHDNLQSKVIDPIDAQLYELAWAAVNLPAFTRQDLRLKALILEEYLVEDDDDLATGLTRSLLNDVLDS